MLKIDTIFHHFRVQMNKYKALLSQFTIALLIGCLCLASTASADNRDEIIFFFNDALGSAVAAVDESGDLCWSEVYTPYGDKTVNDDLVSRTGCGIVGEERGFTGHTEDVNSDLVYMQQRYYDPSIGRFLSIDPLYSNPNDPRTYNRYAYANNNPYKYIDPDGRQAQLGMPRMPYAHDISWTVDADGLKAMVRSQLADSASALSEVTGYVAVVSVGVAPPVAPAFGYASLGFSVAADSFTDYPVTNALISVGTSVLGGKAAAFTANQLRRLAPTNRVVGSWLDVLSAGIGHEVSMEASDTAKEIADRILRSRGGNSSNNLSTGSGGTNTTSQGVDYVNTGTQCTW